MVDIVSRDMDMQIEVHTPEIEQKIQRIRKDWGIFFTPRWVVDFMVSLIDEDNLSLADLKILEPACGICQFLYGIKENKRYLFKRADKRIGVEINKELIEYIYKNRLNDGIYIVRGDYLLWETDDRFDIIIGNPPYGIPSLSEHYSIKIDGETKAIYKRLYETWYGKYNVYGAFIEKSIKLLKDYGQMIFIVPATFMILDEFKKLREFLAKNGKTEIIYMGSDVFKPEANITTVILKFTKNSTEKGNIYLYDYYGGKLDLIYQNKDWTGDVILFSTKFSRKIDEICSFRLGDIFTIRISPRTSEVKRNTDVIRSENLQMSDRLLPILNSKNLKRGRIIYKAISGYWINIGKKTTLRKFFNKPHIVVGLGFRGDGYIAAAYDYKAYPWMGDVYHLLKRSSLLNTRFDLNDYEVVEFLNSEIVRNYVKDVFRDITYHFNITQLSLIPIPTKQELKILKEVLPWRETGEKI